jgi:type I restriction-modification system DNA methylase subunit
MTKVYNCELCKKVFNQKIDFTRHTNKKAPCISIDKMQSFTQMKDAKTDNKTKLSTIFNYCLDVLRNNEHLTGDKALRTLAHLLDLRLLESQFGKQIDIDDYAYNFTAYDDDIAEQHKAKLLKMVRFSNLVKEKEDNIPKIMKCLWDEILSVHPITKNIFLKGKGFDIQHQSTYKKIIDKLYTFDFEAVDEDILGEAYEEVIKDVMIGKTLGQFFTPPKVKQMMVNLINPQINPDGTTETIFDPAMGTGGFLITCLRNLLKKSKSQNIPLNWDFISQHGLGGREAEPDTYQLAVSNMLIASGKMFKVLEKGDSIREPITNKYDIILANPPFGIDGLTYTEIMHPLRNEYMPISSNSAVPLFLQAIIHMLKVNGRCAVVLPEGQELFSKSKALVAVREYLMKTCDLKEVIYLPAGTFTHTTIKTCVFYFHKKKEGKDVLETKLKYSKTTQKETERTYVFSKTHQTHKVKFYDYNTENDTKHLLLEVTIEDLAKNNYSLNYAEYLKDETTEEIYEDGVVVKTLGEVCEFQNGYAFKSTDFQEKNETNVGIIQIKSIQNGYIGGSKITEYITQDNKFKKFEVENGDILIGLTGSFKMGIYKLHTSSYLNQRVAKVICKHVNPKYLYYWYISCDIESEILKIAKGTAQANISTSELGKFKIPIPPIERQIEIVKYLDFIYEKCIKTSTEKILELKQLNEYCLNTQKVSGENCVKMLGEVCKVNQGTYIKPDMKIEGEYPVYGGGNVSYHINQFNRENEIIVAKDGVSADCVRYETGKFFLNHHGWTIICKDIITKRYMFYTLQSIQQQLLSIAKGTAQLGINQENFYKLKIPIPSIERQKEIVEYCEFNDTLIQLLEKEIEQNKKQACLFISGIVKTAGVVVPVENEIVEEASTTPIAEEAPKPKKLVKKLNLKVTPSEE